MVFFFKQKTAYEMRISDWSSDVCSSDLMFNVAIFLPRRRLDAALVEPDSIEGASIELKPLASGPAREIGRASCRERVCQYVLISVVAGSLKKKKKSNYVNFGTLFKNT